MRVFNRQSDAGLALKQLDAGCLIYPVERWHCDHSRGGSPRMIDPNKQTKNGSGLSRRQFLKGSGVAAAATALGQATLPQFAAAAAGAEDAKAPVGMGPDPVKLELA